MVNFCEREARASCMPQYTIELDWMAEREKIWGRDLSEFVKETGKKKTP